MKKTTLFSLFFLLFLQISAQENIKKCITTSIVEKELENNPEYKEIRQNILNNQNENTENIYKNSAETIIPVVIHVIHRDQDNIGSNTNISNLQIEDQLRILNEDFSKTNSEFPSPPRSTFLNSAGNPNMKFCLATTDPNGNPTTGITRTATSRTSWDADDDDEKNYMKRSSQGGSDNWDPLRYMNIWVCNLSNSSGGGQTLGYAYLPGLQNSNQQSWKDGLVVDYKYFGTIGNASSSSDGRTATHEIGHYFGLSHTFCESGGCCDNDNNSFFGFSVNDTPATDDIYFGGVNSNTNNNSCNDLNYGFSSDLLDMDENYMSYSRDTWMFSNGQSSAMNDVLSAPTWQTGRIELKNSTVTVNCTGNIGTGINDSQLKFINVYPNPTTGKLTITSADIINKISITNIIGENILIPGNLTSKTIDISSLENGIYFLNIDYDKGIFIQKIILTK
tara:strand:- start:1565 stop:2911 length:1347 start_codon:yes stop_codon:yes gene_type:complete